MPPPAPGRLSTITCWPSRAEGHDEMNNLCGIVGGMDARVRVRDRESQGSRGKETAGNLHDDALLARTLPAGVSKNRTHRLDRRKVASVITSVARLEDGARRLQDHLRKSLLRLRHREARRRN